MNKIMSVVCLGVMVTAAANATPGYLYRTSNGAYKVVYDYTDKAKTGCNSGCCGSCVTIKNCADKVKTGCNSGCCGSCVTTKNCADKVKTGCDSGCSGSCAEPKADKSQAEMSWYVGGRLGLSLLSWDNEYSTKPDIGVDDGKESFAEAVFGGGVFLGRTIGDFWRGEFEAGLIGSFEDNDQGYNFELTVPYLIANVYRDFANGLYIGAGVGAALPKTVLDTMMFVGGERSKYSLSLMGALMAGWTYKLEHNLVLDFRYRLAMFDGTEQERVFAQGTYIGGVDVSGTHFKNEIGLILDNSVSVGLRYEF